DLISGKKKKRATWKTAPLGTTTLPLSRPEMGSEGITAMTKAEARLFFGAMDQVFAIDLPLTDDTRLSWRAALAGKPAHLLAADGRLFVTTHEGRLYCFGPTRTKSRTYPLPPPSPTPADDWTAKAASVLKTTGVHDGYCIAWGVGSGRLITELARQSKLRIVAVDPDADRARRLRADLRATGLYGGRVAVHAADPRTVAFPPYLASLMVSEDLDQAGVGPLDEFVRKAFLSLRPYGGIAC